MSSEYRIYCYNEGSFIHKWSTSPPSVCPNDSSHTVAGALLVNDGSVDRNGYFKIDGSGNLTYVGPKSKGMNNYITLSNMTTNMKNTSYTVVDSFPYLGNIDMTGIVGIKVIAFCDGGDTSYSIRILDSTNNKVLAEKTGLTNTNKTMIDMGTISNVTQTNSVIEVQMKKSESSARYMHYYSSIFQLK